MSDTLLGHIRVVDYYYKCEHGVVVSQWRCSGGTVKIVPCPAQCKENGT